METEKSLNEMLGQLHTTLLDHALKEAKVRLFSKLMIKEHTIEIVNEINKFKPITNNFNKKESSFLNYTQIKSVRAFYIHYLHTLKQLAQATQKFLKTGTPFACRKIQIFRANLNKMKKDISKEPLDLESREAVSSFVKKYPFDDPIQLMIDMDVRFFICGLRAKHLLKIVHPKELSKVANLLKPVLQKVYWFDLNKPHKQWEKDEQKHLNANYVPLQKFLGKRFAALEDLLFEHAIPTLFQRRVTTILKEAVTPITAKKGYTRYQACLQTLQDFDFSQSVQFTNKTEHLKLLGQAGLSKRNRPLVLRFGEDIYNRCKTALKKEGLFERADKFNLLPGISFSDI